MRYLFTESVQRLDYTILTPHLPPKYEYVIAVKMSDLQVKLYRQYLKYHSRGGPKKSGRGKGAGLFADFQELSRVWTHPKAMLLSEIRQMGIGKESTASFTPSALFGSIAGDSGTILTLIILSTYKTAVPSHHHSMRPQKAVNNIITTFLNLLE